MFTECASSKPQAKNGYRLRFCLLGSLGIDIGHYIPLIPKNRYDIMLEGVAVAEMACLRDEFAISSVFASFWGDAKMKSPAGLRRIPRLEHESQSTGLPCVLIHLSR